MRPSNAIPYAHLQSLRSPLARTGWKTSANRLSPFLRSSLEAVATILGLIGFGCGWVAIASDTPTRDETAIATATARGTVPAAEAGFRILIDLIR